MKGYQSENLLREMSPAQMRMSLLKQEMSSHQDSEIASQKIEYQDLTESCDRVAKRIGEHNEEVGREQK